MDAKFTAVFARAVLEILILRVTQERITILLTTMLDKLRKEMR